MWIHMKDEGCVKTLNCFIDGVKSSMWVRTYTHILLCHIARADRRIGGSLAGLQHHLVKWILLM